MAEEKKMLNENDTVFDTVNSHPGLMDRMMELSPKYARLKNPVLFNTAARVTSLKKAASIGGIYWKEFVYQLNDAIGLGKEYLEKSKSDAFAAHGKAAAPEMKNETAPRPRWMDGAEKFGVMDVRSAGEPFEAVVARAKTLKAGEGFALLQLFVPAPLIGYLETLGFEHVTEKKGDAEVKVYFYKREG